MTRCAAGGGAAFAALLLAVLAGAACASGGSSRSAVDLDGVRHRPLAPASGDVHVLVFTSHECPIANAYAPILRNLAAEWRGQPVRLFVVHVDPGLDTAAARRHQLDYELPSPVLLDPAHELASELGITRTPEAAVLTERGLAYRGRIDDQWQRLGSRAPAASRHDLRLAVGLALRGEAVPLPHPAAVGCPLPEARR